MKNTKFLGHLQQENIPGIAAGDALFMHRTAYRGNNRFAIVAEQGGQTACVTAGVEEIADTAS